MPTYSETMTLSRINRERNRHDGKPDTSDQIWTRLRQDVFITAKSEPMLAGYLHDSVLKHGSLEASLSYLLAGKLSSSYLTTTSLRDVLYEAMTSSEEIRRALRRDLSAVVERDPAAKAWPCRISTSRDSRRCSPIARPTGSGGRSVMPWRSTCKAGSPRPLTWISIRRPGSARVS